MVNTAMHEQQAQQQEYVSCLPKFNGKRMPTALIKSLEKQLKDHNIPERKWLQTLGLACMSSSYWTLVEENDRQDYHSAKHAVLRCLGPPTTNKLDQVFNSRWPKEEMIVEAWEECVQHVDHFGRMVTR